MQSPQSYLCYSLPQFLVLFPAIIQVEVKYLSTCLPEKNRLFGILKLMKKQETLAQTIINKFNVSVIIAKQYEKNKRRR